MGGKICLRCKGETLLRVVNKLSTKPSNVLPLSLKKTFPPIIWIFTEGEGDGIESGLSSLAFLLYTTKHKKARTLINKWTKMSTDEIDIFGLKTIVKSGLEFFN